MEDYKKVDYRIFELGDDTTVSLVGIRDKYKIPHPLFKLNRRSISEGIFESILAAKCGSNLENGNLYMLHSIDDKPMYIYCKDEYMYFGLSVR